MSQLRLVGKRRQGGFSVSIATSVKGSILRRVIENVRASEPRTSALGAVLGGIVAANIDYNKLLQGDPQQIGNLVAAIVVVLLGWFTNHSKYMAPAAPPVAGEAPLPGYAAVRPEVKPPAQKGG
jgi:hypothetical protein